jgi:colicin import membrane protein
MSSSGLWHDLRSNPFALAISIALHVVLIILLGVNLHSSRVPQPQASPQAIVQAVAVDARAYDDEIERQKQAETAKQAAERQRLLDIERKQQAELEQQQRAAEDQRRAQEAKIKADQLKAETLKAEQAKAEQQQKAAQEKQRAEAEQKRKEAEAKRQAEVQRKQAEERRRQDEEDLRRRMAEEEQREVQARQQAERARMLDAMRLQYVKLIEQKVERNWLRPALLKNNVSCEVYVTQNIMGEVISVNLRDCAADAVFQQSIERAVNKASPLPPAPNPDVFDREIHFTFRPR